MFSKAMLATAFSITAMATSAPALAQQSGLVNVTITDVSILNNFLNAAQVAALNNVSVPVNVQVPIGVAANVCGVSAAVLAQAGSAAKCNAKSGSQALAGVVTRQLLTQQR